MPRMRPDMTADATLTQVPLYAVEYQGIVRPYAFGEYHQYEADDRAWADGTFVHQVSGGRFVQRGSLTDLERAAGGSA